MTKTKEFHIRGVGNIKYKSYNKSSQYKYVRRCERLVDGVVIWEGILLGVCRIFSTEREAAIWADKKLIEKGKEPVNILKRV